MTRITVGRRTRSLFAAIGVVALIAPGARAAAPVASVPQLSKMETTTLAMLASRYADEFPMADPKGATPQERADWIYAQRDALGMTPKGWVAWSTRLSAMRAPRGMVRAPVPDLATSVAALDAMLGVPTDIVAVRRAAANMPDALRAPFAELTATVVAAYGQQLPVANAVLARFGRGLDVHSRLLSQRERDAMIARQQRILDAIAIFRARTAAWFGANPSAGAADPIFSDPEGLVILGGAGNDVYVRSGILPDPVLLIDPNGNDVYRNSAGGACPVNISDPVFGAGGPWVKCNGLALSVVADLGDGVFGPSDDLYTYNGEPAAVQGAGGPGGLGILLDAAGNDQYLATMTRGDSDPFQPLLYYLDGGGQGYGYAGAGALIDGLGDDTYRFDVDSTHGHSIWALAQGFGGLGGVGVVSDGGGNDAWLSNGLGLKGGGFEGLYTNGVGFYAGVGIQTDSGAGKDEYRATVRAQSVDFYAQGFGAFGGLGVLSDDGGDDTYYTLEEANGPGAPFINPLLNCAYGTASFGGVGVMVEAAGSDSYYGASISITGATVMDNGFGGPGVGYGLFVDGAGDDRYEMVAQGSSTMIEGRGYWEPGVAFDPFGSPAGHNTWGTFVDAGGKDTYIGGHGANGTVWPFGVDV